MHDLLNNYKSRIFNLKKTLQTLNTQLQFILREAFSARRRKLYFENLTNSQLAGDSIHLIHLAILLKVDKAFCSGIIGLFFCLMSHLCTWCYKLYMTSHKKVKVISL